MRSRRFLSSNNESDEGLVNLTPLIDVVFVVLIMFIIVAPMLEVDRIELAHAAEEKKEALSMLPEASPIAIRVRDDNSIWVNGKNVGKEELLSLLKMAKRQHPDKIPQLFHDKKALFGTYQMIKNSLEMAGFEQLDLILEPG